MPEDRTIATVDEYIAQYPALQEPLQKLRAAILHSAPGAQERMAWQMPTFKLKHNVAHFAVHAHHIGFYPGAEAIVAFAPKLLGYKTSKGAVQFPLDKPLPLRLVQEMVAYNVKRDAK